MNMGDLKNINQLQREMAEQFFLTAKKFGERPHKRITTWAIEGTIDGVIGMLGTQSKDDLFKTVNRLKKTALCNKRKTT